MEKFSFLFLSGAILICFSWLNSTTSVASSENIVYKVADENTGVGAVEVEGAGEGVGEGAGVVEGAVEGAGAGAGTGAEANKCVCKKKSIILVIESFNFVLHRKRGMPQPDKPFFLLCPVAYALDLSFFCF